MRLRSAFCSRFIRLLCTLYAPYMCIECFSQAPSVYLLCAFYSPPIRLLCTRYVLSMRSLDAFCAPSMYLTAFVTAANRMHSRGLHCEVEPAMSTRDKWVWVMAAGAILCSVSVLSNAWTAGAPHATHLAVPSSATAAASIATPVAASPERGPRLRRPGAHLHAPQVPRPSAAVAATSATARSAGPAAATESLVSSGAALLAGLVSAATGLWIARRVSVPRPQCLDPLDVLHGTADRVSMAPLLGQVPKPRAPPLNAQEDQRDPIEKMVGWLFGEKVLADEEPAGLKRMTVDEWPDQWPPVLTEFADPVEGDAGYVASVRPLLKQTMLEKVPLALVYDAEVDGWSDEAFHRKVDGQGAAVVVCKASTGAVFGGYNPKGWLGYGDQRDAISAFLFTWLDGDLSEAALKLPKIGGGAMAILDEPGTGPRFGPDGLKVSLDGRVAASRLGSYYDRRPDGSKTLFDPNVVELKEVKVYVGAEETEIAKNYKPNMLQWQPDELEKLREDDMQKGKVNY